MKVQHLTLIIACVASVHHGSMTAMAQQQQRAPQLAVLCGTDGAPRACDSGRFLALQQQYSELLKGSSSWPVVRSSSGAAQGPTFAVLARLLQPREANVGFAAAFCASLGGRLAYWSSAAEYTALASTVRAAAKQAGSVVHAFAGAVQQPGADREPEGGWLWLHSGAPLPAAGFPWAPGEPNEHNGGNVAGHKEDCIVLATYHPAPPAGSSKVDSIADDFPCDYATPQGKFVAGGHNPKLSLACRL